MALVSVIPVVLQRLDLCLQPGRTCLLLSQAHQYK